MTQSIVPVILCGGAGTRLWPLSRQGYPKQFLAFGMQDSLFTQALRRLQYFAQTSKAQMDHAPFLIVAHEEHRFLALEQLHAFGAHNANLILEPEARNTAPALSLAASLAQDKHGDPILVICPSDQYIPQNEEFVSALDKAIATVTHDFMRKTVALFGIVPTGPETGYGYMQCKSIMNERDPRVVLRFVEKPDLTSAQEYLSSGQYLWNSGIFVMHASTWLNALPSFRPDIASHALAAWSSSTHERIDSFHLWRPNPQAFMKIPAESIDYAVMEPACDLGDESVVVCAVPLNAGWTDLGSWNSLWQAQPHDSRGNMLQGDVLVQDVNSSLIFSSHRLVSVIGLEDVVVVETSDAVLVTHRQQSQAVKNIVSLLASKGRTEKDAHRKVYRPWGWYDSIDADQGFQVKRILVRPGASLSLQLHHHRAEHWIVVRGEATITNGDHVLTLRANQSTYIPLGQKHRLANLTQEDLEIIEVQSGDYLGEDDIVRFDDHYGRGSTNY
jgi:mannose-1-phosphate guanylyltransferase/mannose-6-phosphate isomerase